MMQASLLPKASGGTFWRGSPRRPWPGPKEFNVSVHALRATPSNGHIRTMTGKSSCTRNDDRLERGEAGQVFQLIDGFFEEGPASGSRTKSRCP